jgi:hypothetical protein
MGGIYEVRRRGWLKRHDMHINFDNDWFRHSKGDAGGFHRYPDSMMI